MLFSEWFPLTRDDVETRASHAPAAVQLRRERGLVRYPTGQSAMVFYFFARNDACKALLELFADELEAPGVRGQGALLFRFAVDKDAQQSLEALYDDFIARFGRAPILNDPG